jgi:AraC family transcriptional regulator
MSEESAHSNGGRDRLRELLDAVLDEDNRTLEDMAGDAYSSPYHFSRQLSRSAGEPPVAMKRRVLLERAAWQLRQGASVTDTAFGAGYESVDGFSRAFARAFGHPPSALKGGGTTHWLPAPNGIHFHPPFSLWVEAEPGRGNVGGGAVTTLMLQHDVDDTRLLLEAAKQLPDERLRELRLPPRRVTSFQPPEQSIARLLERLVFTKEVWVASITGGEFPDDARDDVPGLVERHDEAAAAWLGVIRDIERRDAWADRVVDALCDPPETFVLGGIVAHVLTHSAGRRLLVRQLLTEDGVFTDEPDDSAALSGDPLNWMRIHL